MKLVINKDRSVIPVGTWGTVNENDYEILDFEFPAELEEYNKRIVYYLDDQRVWDAIVDNKAIITNAITTKEHVKAYVWLTKTDSQYETDVDFRTQLFEMNFYENENADGIVPTEEQVDGFNTMLTAMNNKIDEVDALEQTIETAEAQRQETEATRVSNENTRESNESTRQTNEQTRQSQEADRERRTSEAIGNIEDKTAEYNANAEAKTTAFNTNATQKTNEFNSNYTQKVNDFNTNATTQKADFNSNASSKTSAFNSNAETKTNTFNTNATNKTNAFNSNATEKTTTLNDNASTKTSEFNTNAESKTTDFNTNATNKTNDFNDNATEKTTAFNNNAQEKIDEYDEHIADYQAQIDELQEEVEELSENMPWNTTEQATEIQVTDAAKYSRNKLELFGNTEQDSTTGKNLCPTNLLPITKNGLTISKDANGNIIINGTPNYSSGYKSFTIGESVSVPADKYSVSLDTKVQGIGFKSGLPYGDMSMSDTNNKKTITLSDDGIIVPVINIRYDVGTLENYILNPQIEIGTPTDYEPYTNGPSPNPDFPQPIHVVTGNNSVGVQGKNLAKSFVNGNELGQYRWSLFVDGDFEVGKKYVISFIDKSVGNKYYRNESFMQNVAIFGITVTGARQSYYFECKNNDKTNGNVYVTGKGFVIFKNNAILTALPQFEDVQIEEVTSYDIPSTPYVPYYHADYPINLGSLELCKIGNYQDYLYKENGNWYKYEITSKIVFNGSENWRLYSSERPGRFYIQNFFGGTYPPVESFCDKFSRENYTNYANIQNNHYSIQTPNQALWFVHTDTETLAEWKEWLANNNVLLRYLKANPESKATRTQITDTTLISQLDAIYEHLQLVKGTNNITVTASDLAPNMKLTYMQDLPSKLDNLDSRLSLLE